MVAIKEIFATNLKKLREKKGLTSKALAEAIGQEPGSIHRYESAIRFPKIEVIEAIAQALGVSEAELFVETESKIKRSRAEDAIRKENEHLREMNLRLLNALKSHEALVHILRSSISGSTREVIEALNLCKFVPEKAKEYLMLLDLDEPLNHKLASSAGQIFSEFLFAPPQLQLLVSSLLGVSDSLSKKRALSSTQIALVEKLTESFQKP